MVFTVHNYRLDSLITCEESEFNAMTEGSELCVFLAVSGPLILTDASVIPTDHEIYVLLKLYSVQ